MRGLRLMTGSCGLFVMASWSRSCSSVVVVAMNLEETTKKAIGATIFFIPYFTGMFLAWTLLPQWLSALCVLPWFYVCERMASYVAWKLGMTAGPE